MKRHLLTVLAVAAVASSAGAQEPTRVRKDSPDSAARMDRGASERSATSRRVTSTSRGEVARRGGAGYSVRAVARDYVGADDTRGDDLWRREQLMDERCGKNRERCGTP